MSVHRAWLSRTITYIVLLFSMTVLIFAANLSHDGQTVALMLAKLGEGPLGRSERCERESSCAKNRRNSNGTSSGGDIVADLCWGYEKNCKKENRLFVPHCNGPPRPWLVGPPF